MSTMNIFDLTDTWNAGATTFTAIKMNATDTASAATSMLIDLQVDGTTHFHVLKSGAVHTKRSNYNITSPNTAIITVSNYSLTGSAANSLVDLSGTWNTAGTPTAIKLNMTDTASDAASLLIDLQVGGASKFSITKASSVTVNRNAASLPTLVTAPTLYSAGVDGSANDFVYLTGAQINRMFFIRANTTVAAPATLASGDTVGQINGGGYNGTAYVTNAVRVQWRANEAWTSTASGTRLEIVTTPNTTNSPANVATFYGGGVHIGNTPTDPGAGALSAQGALKAASLTAIPAGGAAGVGVTVSSTANFGVFFGSGAPTLSAAKGSLYMRSDGSGVNDRMYVNTDGSTSWTAVVTVG